MRRIVAIGIGTRGDIQPLIELGEEMVGRGVDYRVATFEGFRALASAHGVPLEHLDGSAERLSELLVTGYRSNSDFFDNYARFYGELPDLAGQMEEAIRGAGLVLYGTCSILARSICDKYGIRCARVFFSPFDRTRRYSLYTTRRDCWQALLTSSMSDIGMNILTRRLFQKWRRDNGLPAWRLRDDYRVQDGRPVPTFYPVSPQLMPPDPSWNDQVHVTGYWFHPEREEVADFPARALLERFLADGPARGPLFVTLGSDVSAEKDELRRMTVETLYGLGVPAVMQVSEETGIPEGDDGQGILFVHQVPFGWIAPRARAVVNHGGCTTVGLALWAGVPQLMIPLALDQWFYGRQIHDLGLGPAPLYIRKRLCLEGDLDGAVRDLLGGGYDEAASRMCETVRGEHSIRTAADLLCSLAGEA